ncbi:MAG: transporter [Betaproteobacteria bacterium CG2_30_68_42]|nr:MAG: transporter [Betaproteobacteria bacterium CG2_30_68_42]PIX75650.1 MAG: transporter [Rhodocyclales bacterium CG_4_10_14_3_um_filter_68_10]PJA58256.1 MAG: transporter [Rhodocyclales bacterium CG_4_9_14_3_um_filter_68_10]
MKRILAVLAVAFLGLGIAATDADARRLGGGRSFGMQRDMNRQAAPAAPVQRAAPAQAPAGKPALPAAGASRWLGPLAGLAAGLGLAALMSHLGLSEAFGSFLLIALLAVAAIFVVRMLVRRSQPARPLQYAGAGAAGGGLEPQLATGAVSAAGARAAPEGFDAEGFARQAKVNFLRLQTANDAGNLDDIREFTTPEMFAEIRLEHQERGGARQQTDVVSLDAEVLDASEEADRYLASVRFHGLIREEPRDAPQSFDEVWHLVKPRSGGSGWLVAGIQQMH